MTQRVDASVFGNNSKEMNHKGLILLLILLVNDSRFDSRLTGEHHVKDNNVFEIQEIHGTFYHKNSEKIWCFRNKMRAIQKRKRCIYISMKYAQ